MSIKDSALEALEANNEARRLEAEAQRIRSRQQNAAECRAWVQEHLGQAPDIVVGDDFRYYDDYGGAKFWIEELSFSWSGREGGKCKLRYHERLQGPTYNHSSLSSHEVTDLVSLGQALKTVDNKVENGTTVPGHVRHIEFDPRPDA